MLDMVLYFLKNRSRGMHIKRSWKRSDDCGWRPPPDSNMYTTLCLLCESNRWIFTRFHPFGKKKRRKQMASLRPPPPPPFFKKRFQRDIDIIGWLSISSFAWVDTMMTFEICRIRTGRCGRLFRPWREIFNFRFTRKSNRHTHTHTQKNKKKDNASRGRI